MGDQVDVIAGTPTGASYIAQGLTVLATSTPATTGVLAGTNTDYSITVAVDQPTALRLAAALAASSTSSGNTLEVIRSTGETPTSQQTYTDPQPAQPPRSGRERRVTTTSDASGAGSHQSPLVHPAAQLHPRPRGRPHRRGRARRQPAQPGGPRSPRRARHRRRHPHPHRRRHRRRGGGGHRRGRALQPTPARRPRHPRTPRRITALQRRDDHRGAGGGHRGGRAPPLRSRRRSLRAAISPTPLRHPPRTLARGAHGHLRRHRRLGTHRNRDRHRQPVGRNPADPCHRSQPDGRHHGRPAATTHRVRARLGARTRRPRPSRLPRRAHPRLRARRPRAGRLRRDLPVLHARSARPGQPRPPGGRRGRRARHLRPCAGRDRPARRRVHTGAGPLRGRTGHAHQSRPGHRGRPSRPRSSHPPGRMEGRGEVHVGRRTLLGHLRPHPQGQLRNLAANRQPESHHRLRSRSVRRDPLPPRRPPSSQSPLERRDGRQMPVAACHRPPRPRARRPHGHGRARCRDSLADIAFPARPLPVSKAWS